MNKSEERYYKNIAQYIILSLNIPNNQSLVMAFGTGTEQTNIEAITTWIQSLNINIDLYSKDQILDKLKIAAKEHIENTMDYC